MGLLWTVTVVLVAYALLTLFLLYVPLEASGLARFGYPKE